MGSTPTSGTSRWARLGAIVFFVSVAAHLGPCTQYRTSPFASHLISDAASYDAWGREMAAGGLAAQPVFHQAPLYPIVLSYVVVAVGEAARLDAAVALQAVLLSLALAALVPIGRYFLGDARAGLAGAFVALLHGPFVFHSLKILPVSLTLALQAGSVACVGWARTSGRAWAPLAAGLAIGVASMARAEFLLAAPVAAAAMAWRPGGRDARGALLLLAGVLTGVSPSAIHNLRRGDLVLVASSGGENLFIGNQRGALGDYTPLHPQAGDLASERLLAARVAETETGASLRPSQVSAFWRGKAIAEIAADPAGWLRLEALKAGRVFHPGDPTDIYSFPLERERHLSSLWLLPLPAWGLVAAAGWGLIVAARRRGAAAWPLIGIVAVQALALLVFFVNTRLRLPLLFFLTPFAGVACLDYLGLRRTRRRRAAVVWGLAWLAVSVTSAVLTRPTPRDHLRLASVLSSQGRLEEAARSAEEALVANPAYGPAHDQAGWILQKQGRFREASERYRRALDLGMPGGRAAQTRSRLAAVLEAKGNLVGAAAEHGRAVEDPGASAGTWFESGMFRARTGDPRGAEAHLRRAAALAPEWAAPREALARLGARP